MKVPVSVAVVDKLAFFSHLRAQTECASIQLIFLCEGTKRFNAKIQQAGSELQEVK
jgi:hypothetical protein